MTLTPSPTIEVRQGRLASIMVHDCVMAIEPIVRQQAEAWAAGDYKRSDMLRSMLSDIDVTVSNVPGAVTWEPQLTSYAKLTSQGMA